MASLTNIQAEFPILSSKIHGQRLAYLDNAATTQKPHCVIDAITTYYASSNANVHRGVHALSIKATEHYESARETVRQFIQAESLEEIIFTKGTTESINLIAQAFCRPRLTRESVILITAMEHHSNIVPWQLVCEQTGATLKVIPMNTAGDLQLEFLDDLLTEQVVLLSVTHVANALGTINPIALLIQKAKAKGIPVLVDGAQAISHMPVNMQELSCDFYAFSGHKIYGPTGIGVLYAKKKHLETMPPYQGGGDMIKMVSFSKTEYNDLPYKFEAGTPNIAGAIGLARAIQFVSAIGFSTIQKEEEYLLQYAKQALQAVAGIRFIGTPKKQVSVISFLLESAHPHDVGTIADQYGVALRTGHHCSMPVMDFFHIPATVRLSLALYNTPVDIEQAVNALREVNRMFLR